MNKTLNPMATLDQFGYVELMELNRLITAYANAGTHHDGKTYAYLPETWYDDNVHPDFNPNSGMVFLSNSDYQALVSTEYGLMTWYNTPYSGYEGTLFDLAEQLSEALSDKDGNPRPYSETVWHIDDLNAAYGYLDDDLVALRNTEADLEPLYKAKDNIIYSLIAEHLPKVFADFKNKHEDYRFQLDDSKNALNFDPDYDGVSDRWYEQELASEFMTACLIEIDRDIADEDDFNKYAEHIRLAMLVLDSADHEAE